MLIKNKIDFRIYQKNGKYVNTVAEESAPTTHDSKAAINSFAKTVRKLFAEPEEKLTYTTTVVTEIRTNTDLPVYSRHYPSQKLKLR